VGLGTGGETVPLGVPPAVEDEEETEVDEIEVVTVLDEVGERVSGARVDGVAGVEGATGPFVGPSGILIA